MYVKHNIIMIFATAIGGSIYGYNIGMISGILPILRHEFSGVSIIQWSIFTSSFLYGIGCIMPVAGMLINYIGRRKMLLLGTWLSIISAVIIIASYNIWLLIAARFLSGLACGLLNVAIPIFISETITAQLRGRGTVLFQLCLSFGIVLACLAAFFFSGFNSWRLIIAVEFILCLIMLVPAYYSFETPNFLIIKGDISGALNTLGKISDDYAGNLAECERLLLIHSNQQTKKTLPKRNAMRFVLPLFLGMLICILNQSSGINAFLQYSSLILSKADSQAHSLFGSFFIAIVNFFATITAVFIIDRIERKHLLQIGLIGAIGSMCILYYHVDKHSAYLLISGISMFIFCFAIGPGALVWTILSEIMPSRIRGIGMAIALSTSSICGGVITFLFLPIMNIYGLRTMFIFSIFILFCYLVISVFLPNTTGKTLAQIELDLQ